MNFKEIFESVKKGCDYLTDNESIRIYVSSSMSNAIRQAVLDEFEKEIKENGLNARVIKTGSSGYYDLEPIVRIEKPDQPDDIFKNITPETAPDLIKDYLIDGNPRNDLTIPAKTEFPLLDLETRVALRNCGNIDPEDVKQYILLGQGYSGLSRALGMSRKEVTEWLKRSGLRGRGGAGFDTADKWQACRTAEAGDRYFICNAIDADPRSKTAGLLLESDPHSVIEGMLIGAYAVGASKCIICVNKEHNSAIQRLVKALDNLKQYSLAGDNILDSSFTCEIEINQLEASLVAGEETALLCTMDERQAMPFIRPPFPATKGFKDNPTVINNIETLANVSAIFQNEPEWFAELGTVGSKGTKVITMSGDVVKRFTFEVEFGTKLSDIVEKIEHGIPNGKKIKAVQFGGPTGAYFPADSLDRSIDYETILDSGSIVGSGTIEVLTNDSCAVETCRDLISYIHSQSCGKCVFCREGTHQIWSVLSDIIDKKANPVAFDILIELSEAMKIGCICNLGRTAPNPFLSSIKFFREEYDFHMREKRCPVNGSD